MSPKQKQTLDAVKKLLDELKVFNFREIEDEDNTFTLETTLKLKPKVLPIFIIAPKHTDEEIMLTWFWGFAPRDMKSLRMVDVNLKHQFVSDVRYEFGLLNLPLRIYPSPEEIN